MLTAVGSGMQKAVIQEIWLNLDAFLAIYCNYVTARGAVRDFKGQQERI